MYEPIACIYINAEECFALLLRGTIVRKVPKGYSGSDVLSGLFIFIRSEAEPLICKPASENCYPGQSLTYRQEVVGHILVRHRVAAVALHMELHHKVVLLVPHKVPVEVEVHHNLLDLVVVHHNLLVLVVVHRNAAGILLVAKGDK